jgi:cell division protein FtsW
MLILVSLALLVFGLVMGFSASFVTGKTGTEQLADQLGFALIGLILVGLLLVFTRRLFSQQREIWFWFVTVIWLAALVCMILVFVPGLGVRVNGAARWLNLPLLPSFQPSEFAKVALILFAAASLERIRVDGSRLLGWVLIVTYALLIALTLLQNDLGSAMLMHIALLAVMFFGEMPLLERGSKALFSILPLTVMPLVVLAVSYLMPSFRQNRWAGFLNRLDSLQALQAIPDQPRNGFLALGDGGLTGLGFGLSKQKYFYLSFPDSDFIFAIIGEELGLIGASIVILLFILFAWFGLRIASKAASNLGKMMAGGATSIIVAQALVNIGGVSGVLPLTGKPLPFFSMGGSSLIVTLILVGVILSVAWFDSAQESAIRRRDAFKLVEGGYQSYQPIRQESSRSLRTSRPVGVRH